jgi:hypothetical protein
MAEIIHVDLFCEDRAHEEFLQAVMERVGRERGVGLDIRVAVARGGHGRVLEELKLHQRARAAMGPTSDILVAAIDANCKDHVEARNEILRHIDEKLFPLHVLAVPDPHIERWYLADPDALRTALGAVVNRETRKCERHLYKTALVSSLRKAGHPVVLGGAEFAREIVEAMDLYKAGRNERPFKHFLDSLRESMSRLT